MSRRTKSRHVILKLVDQIGVKTTAKVLRVSPAKISRWCNKALHKDPFEVSDRISRHANEILSRLKEVGEQRKRLKVVPIFEEFGDDPIRPIEDFIYRQTDETSFGVIDE